MPLRLRIVSENAKLLGDERERAFAACGGTIGRSVRGARAVPSGPVVCGVRALNRRILITFSSTRLRHVDYSKQLPLLPNLLARLVPPALLHERAIR